MLSHLVHPFVFFWVSRAEHQKYAVGIFRHQKQINLDGTSEAAPSLVGHIHLDKVYDVFWLFSHKLLLKNMCMSLLQAQLERININTQDILQKCEEVSRRYGKKKGHLCHLLRKITFATWYFSSPFFPTIILRAFTCTTQNMTSRICLDCLLLDY
jgi:hypothetical protein